MATTSDLVTRAYRRLGAINITEEPSAAFMTHGTTCLSELMNAWSIPLPELATRTLTATVTSGDTTLVFESTEHLADGLNVSGTGIPSGAYITEVTNDTDVEISANATASGEDVAIAITPIPFPAKHEGGIVALLAKRLAMDLRMPISPDLEEAASMGWTLLLADYMPDKKTEFDAALSRGATGVFGAYASLFGE